MKAHGASYAVWFVIAAALHGGLLFGLNSVFTSDVQYAITAGNSVELTLVEAAGELMPQEPAVPEVESAPPPPKDLPEAIAPPPEPEMIEPLPESSSPAASTPPPVRRSPVAARPKISTRSAAARTGDAASGRPLGVRTHASPNYLSNPPPSYPAASKQAGEQGIVLLSVSVTAQGRTASVRLLRSSGHPRLDEAARATVQRWRFSPARIGSVAIASEVEVPVRFHLK